MPNATIFNALNPVKCKFLTSEPPLLALLLSSDKSNQVLTFPIDTS